MAHLLQLARDDICCGGIAGSILLEVLLLTASNVLSSLIGDFSACCCSFTASLWRISHLALSSVRSGSICNRSDRAWSRIPTTKRSLIKSSFISPKSQLPYGGKLWRVQTLADLAENRPTANF